MSKLDELIKEYCPDGVKFMPLHDFCEIYDGTHNTPEYKEHGVKFVSVENIENLYATDKYISEEAFAKYKVKPKIGDILMTRIGSIGICTVVDRNEPLAYYVSLALIRPNNIKVNSLFLKYAIESLKGRKELRKRTLINAVPIKVNKNDIGKIILPVPPLPVQEEIVRILDSFTSLTAELQAELQARKKQYEYYFNKIINMYRSPKAKLGEIGNVKMCKRILKSQTKSDGDVPFFKIGTFGKSADAYISKELYDEYIKKYSHPHKGDILISCSGTIGRTIVYDGSPAYFQDSNIVWLEHNSNVVTNEYLRYAYMTNPWLISTGGTISRLYNDGILNAEIPLPTIQQQKNIVELLDRFDTICNDITTGLPAEIAARQKQYEYYRDKLLTFKELS